ncbi:protein kinase [Rhodopirellula sp. MGV]|uniref:protein kinase n=1 Tax=Rhodopirellula sp. MGV TaxID=2023130 RepID=UPI00117A50F7|nr:protein kinase [Rhodopirellula sp. MGV]
MRRVVKLGGSLLLQPQLVSGLRTWLADQTPASNLMIAGGGQLIDAVRELDGIYRSDSPWVHWQCVELLRTTIGWLSQQLPEMQFITTPAQFETLRSPELPNGNYLLQVDSFYNRGVDPILPEDWRTTTDAIAGYLAMRLNADELVLLKSCDTDPTLSIEQLAERGIVDEALPLIAPELPPIRIVNFASLIES